MVTANVSMLRTVEAWERSEGAPVPLGATWLQAEQAYNFALFSRHATDVTLLLYAEDDLLTPVYQQRLNPQTNKTQALWHCWVPAASAPGARYYAYRVDGPGALEQGHRFNPAHILLDPYAREVFFPPAFSREVAARPEPNDGQAPLGVLPRPGDDDLYVMINAYWEELTFTVQEGEAGQWLRVVDTSLASPADIAEPGGEAPLTSLEYQVGARTVVILRRP